MFYLNVFTVRFNWNIFNFQCQLRTEDKSFSNMLSPGVVTLLSVLFSCLLPGQHFLVETKDANGNGNGKYLLISAYKG